MARLKARPKTIDEFLLILDNLNRTGSERLEECKSCGDKYGSVLSELTEGHCPACAAEIFYDSTTLVAREIVDMTPSEGVISPPPRTFHSNRRYHGRFHGGL